MTSGAEQTKIFLFLSICVAECKLFSELKINRNEHILHVPMDLRAHQIALAGDFFLFVLSLHILLGAVCCPSVLNEKKKIIIENEIM